MNPGRRLHIDLGIALSKGHGISHAAHALAHAPHEKLAQQNEKEKRRQGDQKGGPDGGLLHNLRAENYACRTQALHQPRIVEKAGLIVPCRV